MPELSGRGIALVAHDSLQAGPGGLGAVQPRRASTAPVYATGTTGALVADRADEPVTRFRSGPHGGDQQIGARIAEAEVDLLVFFWDPLTPQPHEPDVRALLRLAVLANIPVARNRATADYVISSPMLQGALAYS